MTTIDNDSNETIIDALADDGYINSVDQEYVTISDRGATEDIPLVDFAQILRDLGFDAHALSEPDQLHLRFTEEQNS